MKIKVSSQSMHWPEWTSPRWFGLGVGCFSISVLIGRFYKCVPVWPVNAFRRRFRSPHENCWGFGILQIGSRHLFYIGSNEEERLKFDLAFVHIVRLGPRSNGQARQTP